MITDFEKFKAAYNVASSVTTYSVNSRPLVLQLSSVDRKRYLIGLNDPDCQVSVDVTDCTDEIGWPMPYAYMPARKLFKGATQAEQSIFSNVNPLVWRDPERLYTSDQLVMQYYLYSYVERNEHINSHVYLDTVNEAVICRDDYRVSRTKTVFKNAASNVFIHSAIKKAIKAMGRQPVQVFRDGNYFVFRGGGIEAQCQNQEYEYTFPDPGTAYQTVRDITVDTKSLLSMLGKVGELAKFRKGDAVDGIMLTARRDTMKLWAYTKAFKPGESSESFVNVDMDIKEWGVQSSPAIFKFINARHLADAARHCGEETNIFFGNLAVKGFDTEAEKFPYVAKGPVRVWAGKTEEFIAGMVTEDGWNPTLGAVKDGFEINMTPEVVAKAATLREEQQKAYEAIRDDRITFTLQKDDEVLPDFKDLAKDIKVPYRTEGLFDAVSDKLSDLSSAVKDVRAILDVMSSELLLIKQEIKSCWVRKSETNGDKALKKILGGEK